jgi:copper(I)-binding protein
VNLFPTRRSALGGGLAAAILVAATLTGCSSGQQSQTATQEPAVNGTSGGNGSIALRDVRIRADITGAALPAGKTVDLLFVASNQSTSENDRLVSITSDVGSVTLSPDSPQIPAQRALMVGKPESAETEALAALSDSVKANAAVKLNKPITNGLTYNFTFKFERSGQATIAVPITAGDIATRVEQAPPPAPSEGGH